MHSARFETGYMDNAIFDLESVLKEAVEILTPHLDEFDTLVGTGFSGGVVVPTLAMRLGKTFVLIRKESDDSHHGSGRLLGEMGERWIFVDDFVSSGATRRRVLKKVADACEAAVYNYETWDYDPFRTRIVGNYYYAKMVEEKFTRTSPEEEAEKERKREEEERRFEAEMAKYRVERAEKQRERATERSLSSLRRKLSEPAPVEREFEIDDDGEVLEPLRRMSYSSGPRFREIYDEAMKSATLYKETTFSFKLDDILASSIVGPNTLKKAVRVDLV